jgi:hypothetical protein
VFGGANGPAFPQFRRSCAGHEDADPGRAPHPSRAAAQADRAERRVVHGDLLTRRRIDMVLDEIPKRKRTIMAITSRQPGPALPSPQFSIRPTLCHLFAVGVNSRPQASVLLLGSHEFER